LPLDDLEEKITEALCDRATACGQYPSVPVCKSTLLLDYTQLRAGVHAGRLEYDDKQAFNCVKAIAEGQGPGSCSITARLSAADLLWCKLAVKGKGEVDEPCFAANECRDNLYCDLSQCHDGECCEGTCKGVVRMGGDCSVAGSVCADGGYCSDDHTGLGPLCREKAQAGEDCVGSASCLGSTLCLYDPVRQGGACSTLPLEGQPCAADDGPRCDSFKDYCGANGRCVPRVAVGGSCASDEQCAWFATCDPTLQRCVEKGHVTSACAKDDDCLGSLRCTAGICVAPAVPRQCNSSAN
jgi:hypothetical protein